MTYWTIKVGSTEKSFADWGLSLPTRELRSHATSILKLTHAVPGADTDYIFALGATATVYKGRTLSGGTYSGGTIWFYGMFVDPRDSEQAESAQHDYELRDSWHWMERLTFRQQWYNGYVGSGTVFLSKLILFVDINGSPMTAQEVLTEILNYAISSGVPLQIGTLDPNINAPFQAAAQLTCADALMRVLRCAPDCVTFFDYSTTPPTFHVRRISTMSAVAIGLSDEKLTKLDLTPLYTTQVPAVILEYDVTGTIDGSTYYNPAFDKWPLTATGTELGALVANIDLKGVTGNNVQQIVRSQTVLPPGVGDDDGFWSDHAGWLDDLLNPAGGAQVYADAFTIDSMLSEVEDSHGVFQTVTNTGSDVTDRDTYPYELLEGAIAPWMANVHRKERHTVKCSYDLYSRASGSDKLVERKHTITLSVVIQTTNAGNGSGTDKAYNSFQVTTSAEPQPAGLAQYFYTALNVLHYRGTVDLTEAEVGGATYMGNLLNITGGTGKYASINALVSGVKENMEKGVTTVEVSPPKYLSPYELCDLLWFWRNRKLGDVQGRKTGLISGGNTQLSKTTGTTRANAAKEDGKASVLVIEGNEEGTTGNTVTTNGETGSMIGVYNDGED